MLAGIETRNLYLVTFLLSLFLSALAIAVDPVVNNDGVHYLSVANVFAQGEWLAGVELDAYYSWPFYAFLVGSLSYISGLDVETSAWFLNALFDAVTVLTMVAIVGELGGDRKTQLIAAIVFLLFPSLNDYRSFVIRDHGYFAFYALGLLFFMLSLRQNLLRYRFAWVACFLVGMLFRTEAIVFLAAPPLAILWIQRGTIADKIKAASQHGVFLLAGLFAGMCVLVYFQLAHPEKQLAGLITSHADRAWMVIVDGGAVLRRHAEHLHGVFEAHYDIGFSMWAMLVVLVFLFLFELVKALTVPYVLLWWYAKRSRYNWCQLKTCRAWQVFVILNVLLVSIFLYSSAFLVTRYIMALSLTILLCVPFLLNWYLQQWNVPAAVNRRRRVFTYVMLVLAVVLALDSFVSTGTSKTYLRQAGLWLAGEAAGQKIYSSNMQVAFYSNSIDLLAYRDNPSAIDDNVGHQEWVEVKALLDNGTYRQYDYLAIQVRRRHTKRLEEINDKLGRKPVKLFENNKADIVAVYHIPGDKRKR